MTVQTQANQSVGKVSDQAADACDYGQLDADTSALHTFHNGISKGPEACDRLKCCRIEQRNCLLSLALRCKASGSA